MDINWNELFGNAFEAAKKNVLDRYKNEIMAISFDMKKGLHDLCKNPDFSGLFAREVINSLGKSKKINILEISKSINKSYMENKVIDIDEIEKNILG